jgi:heme exporter protein D
MHGIFEVGRYGPYIWPAFGLTAVVLGALIVQTLAAAGRWRREAERLQAEAEGRK